MRIKEKKSRPIRNIFFVSLLISVIYYFYQNRPDPVKEVVETVEAVPAPEPKADSETIPGSANGRIQELRPQLKHQIIKLNAYTYCLNRQSNRAMSSWSRYLSWVDPVKGPQADSRHKYGVYMIYEVEPCQERLQKAASLPVKWPEAEVAAEKYEKSLIELHDLLEKAERYYDQEDYEDDQMAGGKAMHDDLMKAYHAYAMADLDLRDAMAPHRRTILLQFEDDSLQQASPSLFHGLQLLGSANLLLEYGKQEELGDIDTTAFKEHLKEFTSSLDNARAWYEANEGGDSQLIYGMSSLISNAEKLQKNSKKLIRALRDYEPPKRQYDTSRFLSIRMTARYKSEVIKVIGSYNSFLSSFNRLTPFRAEIPYPQWPIEVTLPKDIVL